MPAPVEIRHQVLPVNGIEMHVAEAGAGDPIVCLHGFPELWYSWRHQLQALAAAGYRVIAPDLRGTAGTSAPRDVDAYDVHHVSGDVVGLLDALGLDRAVMLGHDAGAELAWRMGLIHPERVRAIAALSVPYMPRGPEPPMTMFGQMLGDDFYMLWFQIPGDADAAFARDVPRALLAGWVTDPDWASAELVRPAWLTEEDLAVWAGAFEKTGFTGALNWYRVFDRNWELLKEFDGRTIDQPALFVTGTDDPVLRFVPAALMEGHVTDLRRTVLVEGAGHWVQQERPDVVNEALISFLAELPAA